VSVFKKEILLEKMNSKSINGFTIIGIPSDDLQGAYFNNSLVELFKEKSILAPRNINLYFPELKKRQHKYICSLSMKQCVSENEFNIINGLFKEVYEYYQTDIDSKTLNKILGISEENIIFEDILKFTGRNQSDIARILGKSRQLVTDIKKGKAKLSIDNLALLIKEYPLLPWIEYVEGYNKIVYKLLPP